MVKTIKVHPLDNVVIPVRDIAAGTEIEQQVKTLVDIPQGHKIAIKNLKEGEEVIRYGVSLGHLLKDVPAGGHIDESVLAEPGVPDLDELTWTAPKIPPPKKSAKLPDNFDGFEVPGCEFAGTRNILGIMTSVQCVAGVMNAALQKIRAELLPKYPNVDDVTVLNHSYGCGVAINSRNASIPLRTLKNLFRNPNFGGELMLVTLGCEMLTPNRLFAPNEINSRNVIILQKLPGFRAMLDAIVFMAEEKLKKLNERKRVPLPLEKLCIGMQCGGSDAFSGVTANPATGYASDLLVSAGATVLFSEITEVRDGIRYLSQRCQNRLLSEKLIEEMKWYDAYLKAGETGIDANPSPGNKEGGLANITEKTMGSIAKSGSLPITGVLSPGEQVSVFSKGLAFATTPAGDFVCGTLQLASGITLQVFTTGRGTPYGLAAAPVIKISSRTELKDLWNDLIDINAGTIAEGKETIQQVGERIFAMILDTASGRYRPFAEKYRLHNDLCIMDPAPLI